MAISKTVLQKLKLILDAPASPARDKVVKFLNDNASIGASIRKLYNLDLNYKPIPIDPGVEKAIKSNKVLQALDLKPVIDTTEFAKNYKLKSFPVKLQRISSEISKSIGTTAQVWVVKRVAEGKFNKATARFVEERGLTEGEWDALEYDAMRDSVEVYSGEDTDEVADRIIQDAELEGKPISRGRAKQWAADQIRIKWGARRDASPKRKRKMRVSINRRTRAHIRRLEKEGFTKG